MNHKIAFALIAAALVGLAMILRSGGAYTRQSSLGSQSQGKHDASEELTQGSAVSGLKANPSIGQRSAQIGAQDSVDIGGREQVKAKLTLGESAMENVSAMAPDYGRSIAGLPNLESVESVAEWLKVDAGRDDLPAVLPMGLIASYASELEQRSASLAALLVDAAAYEINRGSVIVAETEEGLLEELRDVVRPRRYVEIMAEGESLRGAFMVDIDDHPRLLDEFEAIKVFGQQVKEHLRREVRRD